MSFLFQMDPQIPKCPRSRTKFDRWELFDLLPIGRGEGILREKSSFWADCGVYLENLPGPSFRGAKWMGVRVPLSNPLGFFHTTPWRVLVVYLFLGNWIAGFRGKVDEN